MINERGGIAGKQLTWVVGGRPGRDCGDERGVPPDQPGRREAARRAPCRAACAFRRAKSLRATTSSTGKCPAWTRGSTPAATRTCSARRSMPTALAGTTSSSSATRCSKKLGNRAEGSESRLPERGLRLRPGHDRSRKEARAGTGDARSCRWISTTATRMTDFTPIILKLKSSKPDVIVASCYTNDAILFWKQAKQLDLQVKALVAPAASVWIAGLRQEPGQGRRGRVRAGRTRRLEPEGRVQGDGRAGGRDREALRSQVQREVRRLRAARCRRRLDPGRSAQEDRR